MAVLKLRADVWFRDLLFRFVTERFGRERQKVPFVTVFMLIQLSILSYLLHNWVCDPPPKDSLTEEPSRMAWFLWAILEVALVVSSILTTMIFLLLRALKINPSISQFQTRRVDFEDKDAKDIIEHDQFSIDFLGMTLVPGLTGLFLIVPMDSAGNLKMLIAACSSLLCLSGIMWITS